MAPQTPLIMLDNVFDTVQQYPGALLGSTAYRTGQEPFRVADYRRERSSFQGSAAIANSYVYSDLGAAVTRAVDYVYLDRGHNLFGKTVSVIGDDGAGGTTITSSLILPAVGTLGGDPSAGWCITEEGAAYRFLTLAARRRWFINVVDNMLPVLTGVMLGQRLQLVGYAGSYDEDAGERTEATAVSPAGYRSTDTTYSWRTLRLSLALIGATEYDAKIRALRDSLFKRNQPAVVAMNWGINPERAWMYQFDGKAWSMPKKHTYRDGTLPLREVGPSLA